MKNGTLYLCATPIGNMEDITFRAVRVMGEAGIIAAEDTRRTRKLLAHYDIHTPLVSYHEHNQAIQGPKLIERLREGTDVVCVSDAGLPGIADPGADLVKLALAAEIPVTPLPGANAALSALICSGLSADIFTFVGFLPTKNKKRRELLARLSRSPDTLIFYEAPHRLTATLTELTTNFGKNRPAVLARELTKKFEEWQSGTLWDHLTQSQTREPRGEYVLVVAGSQEQSSIEPKAEAKNVAEVYAALIAAGKDKKTALRETSQRFDISRRDVYRTIWETREE